MMHSRHKFFQRLCLIVIFLLLHPLTSIAQKGDSELIEEVIEDYIVGWRSADKELLKEAFDLKAGVVLWVDKKGEAEQLKSMTLAELASKVIVQEDYGIGYTIQNLEIINSQLAVAIVKIPMTDSHYIDCLELQKINGRWKIVLKSFVYFPKK